MKCLSRILPVFLTPLDNFNVIYKISFLRCNLYLAIVLTLVYTSWCFVAVRRPFLCSFQWGDFSLSEKQRYLKNLAIFSSSFKFSRETEFAIQHTVKFDFVGIAQPSIDLKRTASEFDFDKLKSQLESLYPIISWCSVILESNVLNSIILFSSRLISVLFFFTQFCSYIFSYDNLGNIFRFNDFFCWLIPFQLKYKIVNKSYCY